MTNNDEPKNDQVVPTDADSPAPEDAQPAELMLIQVAEDAAVVFGANSPSWLDVQPLIGATPADHTRLVDAAAVALGIGNVALQLSPALMAAQGIVQLSPVTMAALQTMAPIVGSNGWNIGALALGSQFGHSVQWAPMAAASGATFAATLGTSVALLGIQVQLMQISRKVDANITLTKDVLAELQWANNAELTALVRDVKRAYGEAVAIGGVTPEIYGEIRGKEYLLDKARTLLLTRISAYNQELDAARTSEARRKWLSEHAERSLDDLRSLIQVHQAWFVFQALRAAHVAEADVSSRGTELTARIRSSAKEQNETTVELVTEIADRLQRSLGLLEEADNRRLGHFKSAKEARAQAQALRQGVLETLGVLGAEPGEPEVVLARSDKLDRASRMLPLITGNDEAPALAAACDLDGFRNAFLFVLGDELIISRERAYLSEHRLDQRIPVDAIRFVRTDPDKRAVELATTNGFVSLEWDRGAKKDEVRYANDLLKSLMRLPADEVPERPSASEARKQLEASKA